MSYAIMPSSDKVAKGHAKDSKYPWHVLNVGQSFSVPVAEVKLTTLNTLAYRTSKRTGKKFKVVLHAELQVYEVARLPDPILNLNQPSQPVMRQTVNPITNNNPGAITGYRGFDQPALKELGDGTTAPIGWPEPEKK